MKKFFDGRFGTAVWILLASAMFTFFLSGIFWLVTGREDFIAICKMHFMVFAGWAVVSAVLLVATNLREDWTFGFGVGMYYGTFFLSGFMSELSEFGWEIPEGGRLFLSAIVCGLVCYIVYLKLSHRRN